PLVTSLLLPAALQPQATQAPCARALEADEHLRTPAPAHELEQLRVLVDRQIRLGEPSDLPLRQLGEQLLPVSTVDEGIIVAELDEGTPPEGTDSIDLGEHLLDGLLLVAAGEEGRARAEQATAGGATAGLAG